jgi:hypothetical protein
METDLPDFNLELSANNLTANKVLFYPCCGNDIFDALLFFHPIVETFFFCDNRINPIKNKKIKEILVDFELIKFIEEKDNNNGMLKRITEIWRNEENKKDISFIWVNGD